MAIDKINSTDEFKALIEDIKSEDGYREPIAFGISRVDRGQKSADKILQANYAVINWRENYGSSAIFVKSLEEAGVSVDMSGSEFSATTNDGFI